jgi:hypothetical protein
MTNFFVGVDLGQARDFTVIAVAEVAAVKGDWDATVAAWKKRLVVRLRYLERIELGTTYPNVAGRIAEVTRSGQLDGRCHLAVDATGVGRPVVDMLRGERLGCTRFLPAVVTGGESESYGDGYWRLPKRDLITWLQVLLQRGELQIAAGLRWRKELMDEMRGMEVKVTASGREQFGAWREGAHDDLVFAVGLACWAAKKANPAMASGRSGYMQAPAEARWLYE